MAWTDAYLRVLNGVLNFIVILGIGISLFAIGIVVYWNLGLLGILLGTLLIIVGAPFTFTGIYALMVKLLSDSISARINDSSEETISWSPALRRALARINDSSEEICLGHPLFAAHLHV